MDLSNLLAFICIYMCYVSDSFEDIVLTTRTAVIPMHSTTQLPILPVTNTKANEPPELLKTPTDNTKDKNQKSLSTGQIGSTSHLVQLNGTIISRLIDDSGALTNTSHIAGNNSQEYLQGLLAIPAPDYGIRSHNDSSSLVNGAEGLRVTTDRMSGIHHSQAKGNQGSTDKEEKHHMGGKEKAYQSNGQNRHSSEHQSNSNSSWTDPSDSSISTSTKKPIYMRGHRLKQLPSREQHERVMETGEDSKSDGKGSHNIKTPASMISHYGYPSRPRKNPCWPNCDKDGQVGDNGSGEEDSEPMWNRRKHINGGGNKILNFNQDSQRNKSTPGVYGWILAAAMLTVGSLVSLTGGVLLCFCGEKWKKRREERRRLEKYGEYERVESVSSLVSHVTSTDLPDEQQESVSMI